jgi:hypothetical protein
MKLFKGAVLLFIFARFRFLDIREGISWAVGPSCLIISLPSSYFGTKYYINWWRVVFDKRVYVLQMWCAKRKKPTARRRVVLYS